MDNHSTKQAAVKAAGIDMSKAKFDVAVHGSGERFSAANDAQGHRQTARRLIDLGVTRVGLEASGHYEFLLAASLRQAGLSVARTLFAEPYLSTAPKHQGLLLHSVYHRPNGWDYVARGQQVPNGESSMWGDYHLRELGLLLLRQAKGLPYPTFFSCAQ